MHQHYGMAGQTDSCLMLGDSNPGNEARLEPLLKVPDNTEFEQKEDKKTLLEWSDLGQYSVITR